MRGADYLADRLDDQLRLVQWEERRLVVQSEAHAQRQRLGLQARLEKAENAVRVLNAKPSTEPQALAARAQALLERHQFQTISP